MICLTKLFQQKRRRIGYILAFSAPTISKRDSSGINDKKKKQAQNAITCLKRDLEAKKHNANCEKAENIKRLIMMVKV